MHLVIDTNVFVESISKTSPYHKLFINLVNGAFFICISNSILLEYEEIVTVLHRKENANRLIAFLTISPSVIKINPDKNYNLITTDPDDNKFVDCAIKAGADLIITSDKHFDILNKIEDLKVKVIHPKEFIDTYL